MIPLNLESAELDQHGEAVAIHEGAVIAMRVVAFLNAKHYMVFGDKRGATHGHSWQFQVEALIHVTEESFIKFEDIERHLNLRLAPYQRQVLNDVPPFDFVEPLTENIAVYFFDTLFEDFEDMRVSLNHLVLWENPTKGIEISQKMPRFFTSNEAYSRVIPSVLPLGFDFAAVRSDADKGRASNSNTTEDSAAGAATNAEGDQARLQAVDQSARNKPGFTRLPVLRAMGGWLKNTVSNQHTQTVREFEYKNRSYPWWKYLLSISLIAAVCILVYWSLLTNKTSIYPYGADSWCHLFKADFLSGELLKGNYYPQFFSYWHNGVQPFRYWGPVAYYAIAGLNLITHNVFVACSYFLFLCALLGGLSWLVFTRRIGLVPATIGGAIWVFWVDNLNVMFTSGNYPRVLTIALLPILLELFSRLLEGNIKRRWYVLIVLIVAMMVCSHAMITAVYCVSLMIFALVMWLTGSASFRGILRCGLTLFWGILCSAWWLLPSQTGGGTGFNSEVVSGAITFVPFTISFNPFYRWSEFYWGISLVLIILVVCFTWKKHSHWARGLFLTSILILIFTLPIMKALQSLLPLHDYLWPVRFSSFWSIAFILAGLSFNTDRIRVAGKLWIPATVLMIILGLFMGADSLFSWKLLAQTQPEPTAIVDIMQRITDRSGWREATLDLSRLNSSPSYYASKVANREQVFGWAWLGAKTTQNIMLLNMALENKWYSYVFHNLEILGASDLLVRDDIIKAPEDFAQMARQFGYKMDYTESGLSYWRKDIKGPYMVKVKQYGLAIGKSASIYSILYPSLEVGDSQMIDSYSLQQLKQYKCLVLSGASWMSQTKAERLVSEYAESGGIVFVDLTGFPDDVLARQPKFLEVYGEPVSTHGSLTLYKDNGTSQLEPFAEDDWRCIAPQGLDHAIVRFKQFGSDAALIGYKNIKPGVPVYFLGANLAYHTFLTHDAEGEKIISDVLQVSSQPEANQMINTDKYEVDRDGYSIAYHMSSPARVIIPVAALEGMSASVDGKLTAVNSRENLIIMNLPAGKHVIKLVLKPTPVFLAGKWISWFSLLLLGIVLLRSVLTARTKDWQEYIPESNDASGALA